MLRDAAEKDTDTRMLGFSRRVYDSRSALVEAWNRRRMDRPKAKKTISERHEEFMRRSAQFMKEVRLFLFSGGRTFIKRITDMQV